MEIIKWHCCFGPSPQLLLKPAQVKESGHQAFQPTVEGKQGKISPFHLQRFTGKIWLVGGDSPDKVLPGRKLGSKGT
jgi:hypothetical protein